MPTYCHTGVRTLTALLALQLLKIQQVPFTLLPLLQPDRYVQAPTVLFRHLSTEETKATSPRPILEALQQSSVLLVSYAETPVLLPSCPHLPVSVSGGITLASSCSGCCCCLGACLSFGSSRAGLAGFGACSGLRGIPRNTNQHH